MCMLHDRDVGRETSRELVRSLHSRDAPIYTSAAPVLGHSVPSPRSISNVFVLSIYFTCVHSAELFVLGSKEQMKLVSTLQYIYGGRRPLT